MSGRTRSRLTGSSNNNNKNSKKPGKPKRKQLYRSNNSSNNNIEGDDSSYNADPIRDEEQQNILEIHSEIFAQIYRPIVTRATVMRMYHSARPLFLRKNLRRGYLRANSLKPPKPNKRSKEFSLEEYCSHRLLLHSREPRVIELENVEVKIPVLENKKLHILVTCYEVKYKRVLDKKTNKRKPWSLVFTKLAKEKWSQSNDFDVKFGPILGDSAAIHCTPYLISTNYCVVFQAITYAANDKRLQSFKMKANDVIELPYNMQYSSLAFVHEDIIAMSTRGMCELYSEYLDLIEEGKLMPDAEYRLGTNVFPNLGEPVDTVFKMKSYKAKGVEVIADNENKMIIEEVALPVRRHRAPRRYFTERPQKYASLVETLDSLRTTLPVEYHFRYSIKAGIVDVFTDRVKVETRQNFICPLCLMDWRELQPLLLHFTTTHLDLEITWEKQGGSTTKTGHVQINVSIDRDKQNTFGMKLRLDPGETVFQRFKHTDFPQYNNLPKNLNLNYARKKRNLAKRKVVLSSDGRAQKYRSQTLEPIPNNQLDYDSEDDDNVDRTWMKEDNEKRINDFADFYDGERKFLILWNNFVIDNPIRSDGEVKHACKKFAADHRKEIQEQKLHDLFVGYLMHMWELRLLEPDHIEDCMNIVYQPN